MQEGSLPFYGVYMSELFTNHAAIRILSCPVCSQTMNTSQTHCPSCSTWVDSVAAEAAADQLSVVNQGCSDATLVQSAFGLTMTFLIFGLRSSDPDFLNAKKNVKAVTVFSSLMATGIACVSVYLWIVG